MRTKYYRRTFLKQGAMLGGGLLLLGPKAQPSGAAGNETNPADGAAPPANETMNIVRLSDTMIIAEQNNNRVFALNTARGIVVIDTHASIAAMRVAKELIEAEFKRQDYAFVINTHDHWEHIGGNALFKPQIIVGQEGMIEGSAEFKVERPKAIAQVEQDIAKDAEHLSKLEKDTPAFRRLTERITGGRALLETWNAGFVYPGIMFSDRLTLDLGDRTVILISCGKGHSYSDTLVYIPEEKVLLTGGVCPMRELPPDVQSYAGGAMNPARLISALSEFADSDRELKYIIPGHAPSYLTKADLKFIRDYYRTLWQGFNQAKKDGLTLEQAKQRYSLGSGFGDFPALAKPTDKMIQRHDKNMDVLWAFLNQLTQGRRAAP